MNLRNTILLFLCILLSSCAHRSIVEVSYGESRYVETNPSDAEFMVSMEYRVADVLNDADKFYFKSYRPKTTKYSDGTWRTEGAGGRKALGKYRDGQKRWCNSSSRAFADENGVDINLSIRWGGKSSGKVEEHVTVKWTELPKTIQNDLNGLQLKIQRKDLKEPAA